MTEKEYEKKTNSAYLHQMIPLLLPSYTDTSGLDCLRMIDTLNIKQKTSLCEMLFAIEPPAKFDIFNEKNQRIFQALETSPFCQRLCCATRRRFTLHITNNINEDVIVIQRQFKYCSGCCWCANSDCCRQEVTVESPPGTLIGTVSQKGSGCRFIYSIKDAKDKHIFTLTSPVLVCDGPMTCCCENKFTLVGADDKTEIGAIYKKYRGFFSEACSSADTYSYKVPMDLDVKMKAVVLGAVFLINFMLFSSVPCHK